MKRLITILFLFGAAYAQQPSSVVTFSTVSEMTSYRGGYRISTVADSLRGGKFSVVYAPTVTADNAIYFTAAGYPVGYFWQRDISEAAYFRPQWWGAKGDSSTNDRAAIQSCLDFAWRYRKKMDTSNTSLVKLYSNLIKIDLRGNTYGIDSTITIYPGMELCNGAFVALNSMRTMLTTYISGTTVSGGYVYPQKNIRIHDIVLWGRFVAENGLVVETCSDSQFENIFASGFTNTAWARNAMIAKEAVADNTLYIKVNSNTGAYRNANIMIWRPSQSRYLKGVYQVGYVKSTDTLQLYSELSEGIDSGDVIIHLPTAVIVNTNQAQFLNITASKNALGIMTGKNTNGLLFDDNAWYRVHVEDNNVGMVFNSRQRDRVYGITAQHNNFYNIVTMDGRNINIYDWYSEVTAEDSLIGNENLASGYFENNWGYVKILIPYAGANGWFRILDVDALDMVVDYFGHNGTYNENPNHAGDFSIIKMIQNRNTNPSVTFNMHGPTNFSAVDSIKKSVIDTNYAAYTNAVIVSEARSQASLAGERIEYSQTNLSDSSFIAFWVYGKSRRSMRLSDSAIYWSNGTTITPDVYLRRKADSTIAANLNFDVENKLVLSGDNGMMGYGRYLNAASDTMAPLFNSNPQTIHWYYPYKNAFRNALFTTQDRYLNYNIGNRSIGFGRNPVASGAGSFVWGDSSFATSTNALALGLTDTASGAQSVAIGSRNSATGANSIAIGSDASATANGAVSLSDNSSANTQTINSTANTFLSHFTNGHTFKVGAKGGTKGYKMDSVAFYPTSDNNLDLGKSATAWANLWLKTTPAGTAGTDSILVKHSDGHVSAVSPTYYATSGGVTGKVVMQGMSNTVSPASNTIYYFGNSPVSPNTNQGRNIITIPVTGTITACYVDVNNNGTLGTAETSTLAIRLNNTTDYTVTSSLANNAVVTRYNSTGLSIAVTAGDYIEFKWTTPNPWVTLPTNVKFSASILIQ